MGKKKRLLLIDSEPMVYQLITNKEFLREERNEDDEYWEVLDGAGVKEEMRSRVDEISKILKADEIIMCRGAKGNFRKALYPEYKGHRGKKPAGFHSLTEWAGSEWTGAQANDMEADDVIGILHTSPELVDNMETVVVSMDKDMRTLPGLLFNPDKATNGEPELISEVDAIRWWVTQTLAGDTADGYKGCPGVGAVGAGKLIDAAMESLDPEDISPNHSLSQHLFWTVIVPAFAKAEILEADALIQAQLARILRAGEVEIDGDTWTPKPWTHRTVEQKPSTKRRARRSAPRRRRRVA